MTMTYQQQHGFAERATNLTQSQSSLATSMQRLSSGLRVNSARRTTPPAWRSPTG